MCGSHYSRPKKSTESQFFKNRNHATSQNIGNQILKRLPRRNNFFYFFIFSEYVGDFAPIHSPATSTYPALYTVNIRTIWVFTYTSGHLIKKRAIRKAGRALQENKKFWSRYTEVIVKRTRSRIRNPSWVSLPVSY